MSDIRIGDGVYIHGFVDEVRKDVVIIKNADEIIPSAQPEPCGDAVSREALRKAMYHRAFETDGDTMWQSGCWVRYRAVEQVIKESPSVTPERKKGKWIDYTDDGYVECPFCHSATNCDGNKDELHYCFSCGADMRGGQNDND